MQRLYEWTRLVPIFVRPLQSAKITSSMFFKNLLGPKYSNLAYHEMSQEVSKLHEWSQMPADCIWTFGYRSSDVLDLLGTVPFTIGCLLKTVNALSLQEPRPNITKLTDSLSPEVAHALSLERKMWRSQNEYGFLELSYDPATGCQSTVALNMLQASLFGMHRDEFKARFAAHDLPLFVPPQDLLLLLTDRAVHRFRDGTQYHRCLTSETLPRMPVIMRISTRRSYNSSGQLTSVREGG
jgi:hypothetical protein